MMDKKTVFILGAGASCPYGFPTGANLRMSICLREGFMKHYNEEQQNQELKEARSLLSQAEQVFFLGFGYAPENMALLGLPGVIPPGNCRVYGTAFGLNDVKVKRISSRIIEGLRTDHVGFKNSGRVVIEAMDCLELLRNYLN